jgi:uncharacterized protein (TIGR03435 family)
MLSPRYIPAILLLLTASLSAQTAPTPTLPTFDIASVRPTRPGAPQHTNVPLDAGYVYGAISPDDARSAAGGYLIATHQPLWRYIVFAYKLSATQEMALRFSIYSGMPKSGAPFWVTGSFDASPEFFDISARAPADTSIDQLRLMMRSLLADRFHLAVHFQTADAPAFALVLAHPGVTGPNLQPHPPTDSCAASAAPNQPAPSESAPDQPAPRPSTSPSIVGDLPPVCGVIAHVPSSAPGQHYGGRAIPLSLFATTMPTMTGLAAIPRPVVDQTGLPGLYDFTLTWVHDPSGDDAISDNIANFREALKTQLGLELKSSHTPIDILIVDHVDHPSEN